MRLSFPLRPSAPLGVQTSRMAWRAVPPSAAAGTWMLVHQHAFCRLQAAWYIEKPAASEWIVQITHIHTIFDSIIYM